MIDGNALVGGEIVTLSAFWPTIGRGVLLVGHENILLMHMHNNSPLYGEKHYLYQYTHHASAAMAWFATVEIASMRDEDVRELHGTERAFPVAWCMYRRRSLGTAAMKGRFK